MLYVLYVIVAALIVYLSNKASEYVDLIDKKSTLSGAFLGGVVLSAVTSLPELFTSLSSTIILNKPGLCIGNILGSNLFNISILAILILVAFNAFSKARIAKSHTSLTLSVALIYGVILLNWFNVLNIDIVTISVTSVLIFLIYCYGIRSMSAENGLEPIVEEEPGQEVACSLTLKQITVRFIFVGISIIALSIFITYLTDLIAIKLNWGTGLAGALFLGIATSLPEVSSTISLFRLGNYNIAISNIIGSNIFNFMILSVVDIIYTGRGLYDFSDPKTINLLIFGSIATPLFLGMIVRRNRFTQFVFPICIVLCYVAFLMY
ncbi:MAG: sodium:calcium antiporter [Marinifilaceae bacterium]